MKFVLGDIGTVRKGYVLKNIDMDSITEKNRENGTVFISGDENDLNIVNIYTRKKTILKDIEKALDAMVDFFEGTGDTQNIYLDYFFGLEDTISQFYKILSEFEKKCIERQIPVSITIYY